MPTYNSTILQNYSWLHKWPKKIVYSLSKFIPLLLTVKSIRLSLRKRWVILFAGNNWAIGVQRLWKSVQIEV